MNNIHTNKLNLEPRSTLKYLIINAEEKC